MNIELSVAKIRHRVAEPVRVSVRVHNDGATPLALCPEPLEVRFFVNRPEADWRKQVMASPPVVMLAAGERTSLSVEHELSFQSLFTDVAAVVPFTLRVELVLLIGGAPHRTSSADFGLEIDFRDTRVLLTPEGTASHYVVDGQRVIYVSDKSRAYEPRATRVATDVARARVLSESYLVDDSAVFRDGRRQRGVSSEGFRVLNAIYAGNAEIILTSYGDAKVQEPSTFEVLDAADQYPLPQQSIGYRASFGRDARFVYYFDESTSTKHAVRLKACKSPSSFVVIGHGYARDSQNVYRESQRIQGADPRTWRALSRLFSVDARAAYYGTERIEGVDVASFEVIEGAHGDTPFESLWARDVRGYFERGERRSAADYQARRRER